ncbi:MAG TPA: glutaredoxin family protein [Burkholderiales bacterium]|nr:glutaredoxin family protein [Burkholderiales bacterium]
MKALVLAIALFGVALSAHAQTIYRWVDATGRVRYASEPPPGVNASPVEQRVTAPGTAPAQPAMPAQPQVRMFATDWCPYCAKARQYFARNGIRYTELDIEKSPAAKAEYDRLGGRGVPVIFVGNERINGFREETIARLLSGRK